jgi:uncharacterized membrane protein YcaP (DUF421 family)
MLPGFSNDFISPDISILEKIVRPLIIYFFLLIAFRIFGKRQLGQLAPFDFVVLLVISNVVQNAMIGNDNSLVGGIIGATTILVANLLIAYLSFQIPRLDRLLEGAPTVLIENGQIQRENLKRELVTENDLFHALRRNQIDPDTDLPSLQKVELDSDGSIVIIKKGKLKD